MTKPIRGGEGRTFQHFGPVQAAQKTAFRPPAAAGLSAEPAPKPPRDAGHQAAGCQTIAPGSEAAASA
jgi:hypothetical protein